MSPWQDPWWVAEAEDAEVGEVRQNRRMPASTGRRRAEMIAVLDQLIERVTA
jgi:hypothetical protein